MTGIDRVTAAGNDPLWSLSSQDDAAAELIRAVTDPSTGAVDTRRLASVLSQMDSQAASQGYAQIEAELSRHSPITAAQFTRDVQDAFASRTSGVDYGNIPEEHYFRYDRYLARPSSTPKLGPEEWYARSQRAWANNKSGNSFEQQVRTELGAPLGRGSKPVSVGGRVPDLPVGSEYGVTDVKNVRNLDNSPQLRAFAQYAQDNELPFNLIVGPRTQGISGPVLDNVRATNGTVTEYDPAAHQFSAIEIGESGNWKRPALETSPANPGQEIRGTGNTGEDVGKVPALDTEPVTPGLKAGAFGGAAAGAAVSLIQLAATGKLDPQNLGQVAKGTGESAVIGTVAAKGEQLVTPVIDKVIGTTVRQGATKLAATAVGEGGADAVGVAAGTVVSRVAGATVVGAVITTGISAWENRAGLMHGDSKAIGNVVADTAVGAGSIAAATVAGAAIGSVVPVAGTAVGAVVGLAVGLAVTYGAQISGVRNAIADGAAHAVDGIKSAARGVADVAKSFGSGVSHAASSVAHFFGF